MASIVIDPLPPDTYSPDDVVEMMIFITVVVIIIVLIFLFIRRDLLKSNGPSSSSSSPSSELKYDVFLSFSGKDTRRGFTKHLQNALLKKGIDAYMDDQLQTGIDINDQLLKTIEQSRFAIVVFSKNYASSKWCLNELLHIFRCKHVEDVRRIFPVFYDVEPHVVRHQLGPYGEGLKKSAEFLIDKKIVNEWKKKLFAAANLSGWDVPTYRDDSTVIEAIAKEISLLMKYSFLTKRKNLVGMESRLENLESCLNLKANDGRMIGIWGMIGVGKTTVAEELLKKIHKQFEFCGIVKNIREKISKDKDIFTLQRGLLENLLDATDDKPSCEEGISRLLRLRRRKVLIILDDVDDVKQIEELTGLTMGENILDKFGGGSRILVTTRDKQLLKCFRVHEKNIYKIPKLTNEEALELLCRKAFTETYPYNDNYKKVCTDVVKYASGLPVAIETIAHSLCEKSVNIWHDKVKLLHKEPNDEIIKPMKELIQEFTGRKKNIFLDIACFFNGVDELFVRKIFESCDFHPTSILPVLIDKSLIIIERNKMWMHALLQQTGYHIVEQDCLKNHGNRCRFWLHEHASDLLEYCRGTTCVEGIFLTFPMQEMITLNADSFSNMSKLRLLRISNVDFSGCLNSLPRNLRVLDWDHCLLQSMPTSFQPGHLVELHMPNSTIQQPFSVKYQMEKLTLINLSKCQNLTTLPDFTLTPNLETLILEGCTDLSEIHSSIGKLRSLAFLNIKDCKGLESLPPLNHLRALQVFILSGCSQIQNFPEIEENMDNLCELYLDATAIRTLPMQRLTGLILLSLADCKNISELPNTIYGLTSLKSLNLTCCSNLNQLPDDISRFENLQELHVKGTSLRQLPSSIQQLKSLKLLSFHRRNDSDLPNFSLGIWSLISLDLSQCNLTEFPIGIECISSLQYLNLSENSFERIPVESISQLSKLRELHVSKCNNLLSLPKHLPSSLKYVNARGCPKLACTNHLTIWTSLKGLSFIDCRNLNENEADYGSFLLPEQDDGILPQLIQDQIDNKKQFQICFPHSRIPDWCTQSTVTGNLSLHINNMTIGVALFVVFKIDKNCNGTKCLELMNETFDFHCDSLENTLVLDILKDHTYGLYGLCVYIPHRFSTSSLNTLFSIRGNNAVVKRWGIHPITVEGSANFIQNLCQTSNEHLDLSFISHCDQIVSKDKEFGYTIWNRKCSEAQRHQVDHNCKPCLKRIKDLNASLHFTISQICCYLMNRFWFSKYLQNLLASAVSGSQQNSTSILQKYGYYFRQKQGHQDQYKRITFHSKCNTNCIQVNIKNNRMRNDLQIETETPLYKRNSVEWKRKFEYVLPRLFENLNDSATITLSLQGHPISVLERFDPSSTYNFCFCGKGALKLFCNHQSDTSLAIINTPANLCENETWKGLLVCVGYSLQKQPTSFDHNVRLQGGSSKLLCHLRTNAYCLNPIPMLSVNKDECFKFGEPIWLTYVPKLLLCDELNKQSYIEARIYSNDPSLIVDKCGISLLFEKDMEGMKRNITQCWTSFFDNFDVIHQLVEPEKPDYSNNVNISNTIDDKGETIEFPLRMPMQRTKNNFDADEVYNNCFSSCEFLDLFGAFGHQTIGSSVTIQLPSTPEGDSKWVGLTLCAHYYFNYYFFIEGFNPESSKHDLICHLETERGNDYKQTCSEEFLKLSKDGFIWLSYLPRWWFVRPVYPSKIIVASFTSKTKGLSIGKCGLRLIYQHEEEEFRQHCIRMDHLPVCKRANE